MCTAISVTVGDNYFGRNLDYEHRFGEKIVITPKNYEFIFRNTEKSERCYAIIGMALPLDGYPLYFDATNEKGLSMAGLNFPDNAKYNQVVSGKSNVASFEFIPWVLSRCENVCEAEKLIEEVNITDECFKDGMKPTPLHWIVADRNKTITVEQTKDGLKIWENPVGVLTNNPEFNVQMFNLTNFMAISADTPRNNFSEKINLRPYSRGLGGMGLPGDLSSISRFIRACFVKLNSVFGETEREKVSQFFHILYSVYQQKGCVKVGDGYEITNYTSCCNTDKGIYYYTTYFNSEINAVDMNKENLEGKDLIIFDLVDKGEINIQN